MTTQDFKKHIWNFYQSNKRTFPWRETRDPYAILVSEIMLQQTQTHRVVPKYLNWLQLFPTSNELAQASLTEILSAWSGLGYNRRAKFLWEAGKMIQATYSGTVPSRYEELRMLPGIGEYTANAVLAFAFNQPTIVLETNIRTAIIHDLLPDRKDVHDNEIKILLGELVTQENPREWYYALMDYGSWLKSEGIKTFHLQKSYTKQKPFKGSERFVRGYLLKEALALHILPLNRVNLPGYTKTQIREIASDLVQEGLLSEKQKGILEVV